MSKVMVMDHLSELLGAGLHSPYDAYLMLYQRMIHYHYF